MHWSRLIANCALILFTLSLIGFFTLTDDAPSTKTRPVPTTEQVGAGRDAMRQFGSGIGTPGNSRRVRLRPDHLDGLSALATHGFRPARLDLSLADQALRVSASHKLPVGRWLNVVADVRGSGAGFPIVRAKVGSIPFSAFFSRLVIDVGRSIARARGADIPPLDDLVRHFGVKRGALFATVEIDHASGIVGRLMGVDSAVNAESVSDHFCRLAEAQAADPQSDFAVQVRRAFPADQAAQATPESNSSALVALAMAVVGKQVGVMARIDPSVLSGCSMPATRIVLHGREDLPKHWALSAALEVLAGRQFAQSIGEWKELVDGLPRESQFQSDEPTGFSLVDLAANRSGLRIAHAVGGAASAATIAGLLSVATEDDILPPVLLKRKEGAAFDFEEQYGEFQDPRFVAAISQIDDVLDSQGLTGSAN